MLRPRLIPQLGIMDTMDILMVMDMPDTTDLMDILTTDTVELDAETPTELWFPALANKMCSPLIFIFEIKHLMIVETFVVFFNNDCDYAAFYFAHQLVAI